MLSTAANRGTLGRTGLFGRDASISKVILAGLSNATHNKVILTVHGRLRLPIGCIKLNRGIASLRGFSTDSFICKLFGNLIIRGWRITTISVRGGRQVGTLFRFCRPLLAGGRGRCVRLCCTSSCSLNRVTRRFRISQRTICSGVGQARGVLRDCRSGLRLCTSFRVHGHRTSQVRHCIGRRCPSSTRLGGLVTGVRGVRRRWGGLTNSF